MLPAIICTWSDYGQHKVYYRGEKEKKESLQETFKSAIVKWTVLVSGLVWAPEGFVLPALLLTYHQPYASSPFYSELMCPFSSSPCPLLFPDLPFLYQPCLSSPITPHLPFPSIPLACINLNPPHIWRDRHFFTNDTGWVERVMESVVKRNKSITLIGKKINFPLIMMEVGWLSILN